MYCAKCGTKYDGDFCPNCGTPAPKKKTSAKHSTKVDLIPIGLKLLSLLLLFTATLKIIFDSTLINMHQEYSGRLWVIISGNGEFADEYRIAGGYLWLGIVIVIGLIGLCVYEFVKGKDVVSFFGNIVVSLLVIVLLIIAKKHLAESVGQYLKTGYTFSSILLMLVSLANMCYPVAKPIVKDMLKTKTA